MIKGGINELLFTSDNYVGLTKGFLALPGGMYLCNDFRCIDHSLGTMYRCIKLTFQPHCLSVLNSNNCSFSDGQLWKQSTRKVASNKRNTAR